MPVWLALLSTLPVVSPPIYQDPPSIHRVGSAGSGGAGGAATVNIYGGKIYLAPRGGDGGGGGDYRGGPSAPSAQSPSFNCGRAMLDVEKAICSDNQLANLDVRLTSLYNLKKSNSDYSARESLVQSSRGWLAARNAQCGGLPFSAMKRCLLGMMQARIGALESF